MDFYRQSNIRFFYFWRNFHQTVQQSIAEQLIFEFVSSLRRSVSYSM